MEEIIGIYIVMTLIAGILLGYVVSVKAQKPKPKDEDEYENGGEHEGYPDLSGIQKLSDLEYETATWNKMGLVLHSYFLGGNSYQLDKVNLTIDMGPRQHWAGVNQCLFYMSDEAIPNQPELYEIRTSCDSNKKPWKVEAELIKKKKGRYFIIGFTNKHDFIADGEIEIQ